MNQNNNDSSDKAVLFVLIAAMVFGAYWFFAPKAQELFLTIKMWQMSIISVLVPTETNKQILHILQTTPSTDWSLEQIRSVSRTVNMYILPFFVAFVGFCYIHITKYLYLVEKNKGKNYTIDTLMQQEVNAVWRYLKPIKDENLLENRSADWARAMKPQEFAIHNDLLNIPDDLLSLNEEKTKKVLALQLGQLYIGADQMPVHVKALLGCFAEHLYDSPLRTTLAFMDICDSYAVEAKGKYNYSSGLALFEKHKNNEELNAILNSHAYVYTAIADVLERAKERGIIISKYFLWLKKTDRRLYYMLNRMGRQVSWVECAGIVDHYQHEKELGRPLAKIFCDAAFAGIKEELKNVKITTRNKALMERNREIHNKINEQVYGTS